MRSNPPPTQPDQWVRTWVHGGVRHQTPSKTLIFLNIIWTGGGYLVRRNGRKRLILLAARVRILSLGGCNKQARFYGWLFVTRPRFLFEKIRDRPHADSQRRCSASARAAGWGAGAACEPLLGRLSNLSSPQLGFRGGKLG
jgi:hypothetical protein